MTRIADPYYHPPDRRMGNQSDFLDALVGGDVDRVIRGVIRRVLGLGSRAGLTAAEDEEDVRSEVLLLLVRKLHRQQTGTSCEPIADFSAYAATVAHHACYGYLRRRRPEWTRLRNQVRYLAGHDPELSLERADDRWFCVAQTAGPSGDAGDLQRLPLRELARALVRRAAGRMALDELVTAVAEVKEVHDAGVGPAASGEAMERLADPTPPVTVTLDNAGYLQRVWVEVQQLPVRQRWALLLNLRNPDGQNLLPLLPLTGTASLRQIADVLELPARELAELWKDLPLDDLAIAGRLGLSRQQVINLRKSARERLKRRLVLPGNTSGDSRVFMVRQDRPVNGAS